MATFTSMLQTMKQIENYSEKIQFTTYILQNLENKRVMLTKADKEELSAVAFEEITVVGELLDYTGDLDKTFEW